MGKTVKKLLSLMALVLALAACGEPSPADEVRSSLEQRGYAAFVDELSDDELDDLGAKTCEDLAQMEPVSGRELGQYTEGVADAGLPITLALDSVLAFKAAYCPSIQVEGAIVLGE